MGMSGYVMGQEEKREEVIKDLIAERDKLKAINADLLDILKVAREHINAESERQHYNPKFTMVEDIDAIITRAEAL